MQKDLSRWIVIRIGVAAVLVAPLIAPLVGCGGSAKTDDVQKSPATVKTTVGTETKTADPAPTPKSPATPTGPLKPIEGKSPAAWVALITNAIEGETARDLLRQADGEVIPLLIAATRSSDAVTRRNALAVLKDRRDRDNPEIVEAMIVALADADAAVRSVAVKSVREVGPAGKSAIGPLTKLLANPGEKRHIRLEILLLLGELGPHAAAAVPAVTQVLLKSPERFSRTRALRTLEKIGLKQEGVLAALAASLAGDQNVGIRLDSLELISRLGPAAAPVTARLIGAFRDPERDIRTGASKVLEDIGAKAVPALIEATTSTHNNTRHYALFTLGHIGPAARAAIGPLTKLLQHEHKTTQTMARQAISSIKGDL
jgi:HEAT repeat protein